MKISGKWIILAIDGPESVQRDPCAYCTRSLGEVVELILCIFIGALPHLVLTYHPLCRVVEKELILLPEWFQTEEKIVTARAIVVSEIQLGDVHSDASRCGHIPSFMQQISMLSSHVYEVKTNGDSDQRVIKACMEDSR